MVKESCGGLLSLPKLSTQQSPSPGYKFVAFCPYRNHVATYSPQHGDLMKRHDPHTAAALCIRLSDKAFRKGHFISPFRSVSGFTVAPCWGLIFQVGRVRGLHHKQYCIAISYMTPKHPFPPAPLWWWLVFISTARHFAKRLIRKPYFNAGNGGMSRHKSRTMGLNYCSCSLLNLAVAYFRASEVRRYWCTIMWMHPCKILLTLHCCYRFSDFLGITPSYLLLGTCNRKGSCILHV